MERDVVVVGGSELGWDPGPVVELEMRLLVEMVKRASAPGKTTEKVAKCLCNLGLMVKLPAVGFMQATYCTLWMSF